jgi:Domain of unknown function (DUF5615)
MSQALVDALRARGADVVTPLEVATTSISDEEQLRFATSLDRAIYSFNIQHFCAIHADFLARGEEHAGIIVARQQTLSIGEQMRRLLRLTATRSGDQMRNQLEFLAAWGSQP